MKVVRLTQPSIEPVTVAEAMAHLRQIEDDEESLVAAYVSAARERVENYCNRPFTQATFAILPDAMPTGDLALALPFPVTTIDSVTYRDSDGDEQTWDGANYSLDAVRGVMRPADTWPDGSDLRVNVTAGDASSPRVLPAPIRAAILLYTADLYEVRQAHVIGASVAENPAAEMLMDPYRVRMGI